MKQFYDYKSKFIRFVFFLLALQSQSFLSQAQVCDCKEYVFVNEPFNSTGGRIHKFLVNGDGSLTEVNPSNTWYPNGGTSELPSPHGLGTDINGNFYVSESYNSSNIRKITCDGKLVPTSEFAIPHNGSSNITSIGNTIIVQETGVQGISLFDVCSQQKIGEICFDGPKLASDWGLYKDYNDVLYVATGEGNDAVYRFTLADTTICVKPLFQGSTGAPLFDPTNNTANYPFTVLGITSDNDGNIYVASGAGYGFNDSKIYKYSPQGVLLATSVAIPGMVGIVYVESSNSIYASIGNANADCVQKLDLGLSTVVPVVGPGLGDGPFAGKAIARSKECCPVQPIMNLDTTLCLTQIGASFYLQDLIKCDGTICEGEWTVGPGSTGLAYDPCDNSVTVTSLDACGEFIKESDGTGANAICGAFSITLKVQVINLTEVTITGDQSLCPLDTPVPLTSTGGTSVGGTLSYQWQKSTESCGTGFVDIPGANQANYTPELITEKTYFRLLVVADGTCATGNCSEISNCVTLTPDVCPRGSIGDYVWEDSNNNGIQDAGEPPLKGVKVFLEDAQGQVIDSTVTNANGVYKFNDLFSGDYKIKVELPADSNGFSPQDATNDNADSDVDPFGVTATINVNANLPLNDSGRDITNVDIGIKPKCKTPGCAGVSVKTTIDQ